MQTGTPGYLDSLDIANRACFHVGAPQIQSVSEDSQSNAKCTFVYDKLRRAELQRSVWTFATRRAVLRPIETTTRFLVPKLYSSTVTYSIGALARDANGVIWQSAVPDNLSNAPHTTTAWEQYFGPLTVSLYVSTTTYHSGELVYKAGTNPGSYIIFMSLQDNNADVPSTATAYSATVTYKVDQQVSSGGSQWRSLIDFNIGVTPADAPATWDTTATYAAANQVTGSDGFIYTSIGSGNTGNDPVGGGGIYWTATAIPRAWSRVPTNFAAATSWLPIYAEASSIPIRYPVGSGPLAQQQTRNLFQLPAGYLRMAPQSPKQGGAGFLGAPNGVPYRDWEIEYGYITSMETKPIIFRFVADLTDVRTMHDMFCEGLALRMGIAICEPLTQSATKKGTLIQEYRAMMTEARLVNAIEAGAEEPPEDDFITCRV